MKKARVMLIDRNQLFLEGIGRILVSKGMEVFGEAGSADDAIVKLRAAKDPVDLILFNLATDVEEGCKAVQRLAQEFPATRLVILSESVTLRSFELSIATGACGFLPKSISGEALYYSLELVLLGERVFPALHTLLKSRNVPAPLDPQPDARPSAPAPSPRERQILDCLTKGQSNKVIARNLNMAEATVKVHMKALMRKISAQNRTQAAMWAINCLAEASAPLSNPMAE